jgi:hypothetical protein
MTLYNIYMYIQYIHTLPIYVYVGTSVHCGKIVLENFIGIVFNKKVRPTEP